jgi:hypothetical protein
VRGWQKNLGSDFVEAIMKAERKAILSMVAMGRITPGEAERLLAAASAGREEAWALAVCLAMVFTQIAPALARLVEGLLSGGFRGLHHAITAITYGVGGLS